MRTEPAGAVIDGPRGWLHLKGAFASSSFKQHVLLEQMTVEGALCSKASYGRYQALGGPLLKYGGLDCKRRSRMRPPPPTAATMRARMMMDEMTCTKLPAAAMGQPSLSAEVLSWER